MKKYIYIIVTILILTASLSGCKPKTGTETIILKDMFPIAYDRSDHPDPEQLSIVRYILSHTLENNIHKMRGEVDNVVLVNADGREGVYDKNDDLVTNSYNKGSFNFYFAQEEPIKKFLFDTAPWLKWGNDPEDPTSFEERLYYYTLDLDIGIQDYIFFGSNEILEEVSFLDLQEDEKEVYYLFLHLLFNDDYEIQLSSGNMERLQDDGEYYFEYFFQIQKSLNLI